MNALDHATSNFDRALSIVQRWESTGVRPTRDEMAIVNEIIARQKRAAMRGYPVELSPSLQSMLGVA